MISTTPLNKRSYYDNANSSNFSIIMLISISEHREN